MSILQTVIETVYVLSSCRLVDVAGVRQARTRRHLTLQQTFGDNRALAHALAILEERSLVSDEARCHRRRGPGNDGHLLTCQTLAW